jgi:hypothetical protein
MAKTCSIDRLIQITRQQWKQTTFENEPHSESMVHGSATKPLIVSVQSIAMCGLQSAHDFTGMGAWRINDNNSDDNSDDTVMAAA